MSDITPTKALYDSWRKLTKVYEGLFQQAAAIIIIIITVFVKLDVKLM